MLNIFGYARHIFSIFSGLNKPKLVGLPGEGFGCSNSCRVIGALDKHAVWIGLRAGHSSGHITVIAVSFDRCYSRRGLW